MFEHLDDPRPFDVGDLRAAVVRRGQRLQGRAKLRTALVSLSATVLLFASAIGGYARWQVSRIERVSIAAIPQVDLQGNPVAPNVGALDRPFTMLVIGNDDAPDVSGRGETNLADSIMLVRVDQQAGAVRVVSIPRDTLVTLDDGTQDRINAARRQGIPALVTTINRTFGLTVDHYVEAHFQGFERLVESIGGVPLVVDQPIRDRNTGLDLQPGCHVLDGTQALALARSRHLEVRGTDGRWVTDPRSDLGRIARQQLLGIAAAKHAARSSLDGSLGSLDALVGTDPSQITLDDHLGLHDLLDLSEWVGSLPDGAITTATPSVRGGMTSQGAAVLELADTAATQTRQFLLEPATTTSPASGPTTSATTSVPVSNPDSSTPWIEPVRIPTNGECA